MFSALSPNESLKLAVSLMCGDVTRILHKQEKLVHERVISSWQRLDGTDSDRTQ